MKTNLHSSPLGVRGHILDHENSKRIRNRIERQTRVALHVVQQERHVGGYYQLWC